jgi:uncharacterized membrane protein YdbT with pleckstrin-like domain
MDFGKTQHLGPKAFFVFLAEPLRYFIFPILLVVLIGFGRGSVPESYKEWADWAFYGGGGLILLALVMVSIRTYLEYKAYTYVFDEEAFIVRYGYVVDNEVALLYHQIRNVNIDRYIPDRLFGVSQLKIVMVGSSHENAGKNHPQGMTLPAIQKDKARLVQRELLRRARVHFQRETGD